jgi:hypothetical protein
MEITCARCHRTVQDDNCYCSACGLPQLVFTHDDSTPLAQTEPWDETVRDAASVDWKPALQAAITLAVPAGLLSSGFSPLSILGLFWMAAAAAWAVVLYVRRQRPAWITIGAGARIGLVTGLLGGWTAAGVTGVTLFAMRFLLHQSKTIDDMWLNTVSQMMAQQSAATGADAQAVQMIRTWMLSPEGRAGSMLGGILFLSTALVLFAVGGGALGSRLLVRARRPEI